MLQRNPIRLVSALRVALILPYLGMTTGFLAAQEFSPGTWTEEVVCRTDPEQRYALYLPPGYTPERSWPTLIVLDARGRAMTAAERFEAAAERFGWIVASSYGTESDSSWEPNRRALAAMLPDLESRVSLDLRRQVFAGFSGTARIVWALAVDAPGMVDGVIAASGGTSDTRPPDEAVPVPVFLTAGERDFNLLELRRITRALEDTDSAFRLETFDGIHQWMPEDLATEALAWMELQAMRQGLRPIDESLVSELLEERIEAARRHAEARRPLEALADYRSALRDFEELVPREALAPVRDAAQGLEKSPELRRAQKQRNRLEDQETTFGRRLNRALHRLRTEATPPPADKLAGELDLSKLEDDAEDDSDPARAAAASRMLAQAYTHFSFYLPREMLDDDEPWRALTALEIAHGIYDGLPRTWLGRARALTRLGRLEDAVEVLAQGFEQGVIDAEDLEGEEDFEPLRTREDFQSLSP